MPATPRAGHPRSVAWRPNRPSVRVAVVAAVFLAPARCSAPVVPNDADPGADARAAAETSTTDTPSVRPDALADSSDVIAPADAPDTGWRREPSLPVPWQELAGAVIAGRIFVVGGFESIRPVTSVRVFDPSSGSWSSGPPLPTARHHIAVVALGGDLSALGGELGLSFTPDATCYVLRRGATSWTPIASLPAPRGAGVAGAIAGRIYVAAGVTSGGTLAARVAIYDPSADRWTEGAAIPTPREHLAGFVHGDRLFTVGGRRLSLTTNMATVEIYDPAMDRWVAGPAMPTPRGGLSADVLGGRAYAVGGEQPDRALDVVEVLDLSAMRWTTIAPVPTPRHGHLVAAAGVRIYVIGGADQPIFAAVNVVESYAP